MRGVLLTGGLFPARNRITHWLQGASVVVAADSGYDSARLLGIEPDLVVGDMDSIANRAELDRLAESRLRIFPADKDFTDTELGVEALLESGAEEIIVIGGGGGRLDHLLGIVALFDRPLHPLVWMTHNADIYAVDDEWHIDGVLGQTLSFFPAGSGFCTMESRGLKWNLNGLEWRKGSVGISNIAVEDRIEVHMLTGRLIMVRPVET